MTLHRFNLPFHLRLYGLTETIFYASFRGRE